MPTQASQISTKVADLKLENGRTGQLSGLLGLESARISKVRLVRETRPVKSADEAMRKGEVDGLTYTHTQWYLYAWLHSPKYWIISLTPLVHLIKEADKHLLLHPRSLFVYLIY